MKVPFLDLKAQYLSIKDEIDDSIVHIIDNTAFVLGKSVHDFENQFAALCHSKYAIGVSSGTAALHVALLSLGIKEGDEVITAPNTFFATVEAIVQCRAKPVFVDIDEASYNVDSNKIENAITDKTKAIIPVHLYGNPADMAKINDIAEKHKLFVIEDACQAHGAEYKGNRVGSMSDIAAFSFYPGKNLGAFGEGGAVVTNNEELSNTCNLLRAHGESPQSHHLMIGYNYRMEGIQGAVLGIKLKYLSDWNEARRKHARRYDELLEGTGIITPKINDDDTSVFHLYVIRHSKRDKLREFLWSQNIDTRIHYPIALHLQKALKYLGYKKGAFPVTERVQSEIVSLPMYPELTKEQVEYTVDAIRKFNAFFS